MKLRVWALNLLLLMGLMPVTGCSVTAAQIKADGQAVATACQSIAAQLIVTNPAEAAALTTAANALLAATANWQSGSPTAILNDAAAAVEAALAAIPQTSVYAPLVAIAVVAVDILLGNIGNPAPSPVAARNESSLAAYRVSGAGLIHHRLLRSPEGDFAAAWNNAVTVNHLQPSLALR